MSESQPPLPPERAPTEAASPELRPPRRGSLLRRTLGLLLLVLVLAVAAVLTFADRLLLPWLLPVAQAEARAHGLQLEVARLAGSLTSTIVLQDVRVTTRDPSLPAAELLVPELELHWSPWRALIGAAEPLHGLHLHGGTLHLDLTRDGDADAPGAAWEAGTLARLGQQLDLLPALSVDDLRVDLRAPSGGLLDAPELVARATLFVDGRRVELRDGRVDGDGPEGRLPEGLQLLAPLRLDLSRLDRDELPFELEVAAGGGVLSAQGSVKGDTLASDVTAQGVALEAVWRAVQGAGGEPSPLSGPLLLEGELRVPLGAGVALPGAVSADAEPVPQATATAHVTLGAFRAWGLSLDGATGALSWRDGALHAEDVQLTQHGNRVLVEQADLPAGADWQALALQLNVAIDDVPALLASLRAAELLPDLPESHAWELARQFGAQVVARAHSLTLHAALRDGTASVTDAVFRTAGGSLSVPRASLDLSAPDLAAAAMGVRLDAEFTDLAPLGALLGERLFPGARSAQWAGALTAHLDLAGSIAQPVAQLQVDGRELLVAGWPLGVVTLKASADARELTVAAFDVEAGASHVSAQGALDLASLGLRGVRVQVNVPDLAAALPDSGVRGALDARGELDGPLVLPLGSLELHVSKLFAHGVAVDDLQLAATRTPGVLGVQRALLQAPWGTLEAAGSLNFDEADDGSFDAWPDRLTSLSLDRLVLSRGTLDLSLAEPATLRRVTGAARADEAGPGLGVWSGGPLQFAGSAGVLHATLLAAPSATGVGTLQRVQLVAERLQPLLPLPADSSVETFDGDLDVVFGAEELAVSGTLRGLGLALALGPGAVGAEQGGADEVAPGAAAAGAGRADSRVGVRGDVTAWLRVTGTLSAPRGEVEISGRRVVVTAPGRLAAEGFGPCTLDAHVTLDEQLVIDWLHVDSPHQVHLDAHGTMERPSGDLAQLAQTPVHMTVSVSAGELDRLSQLLLDVRRMSGELAAELSLDGPLGAPHASGSIDVRDGELRLQGALPALDALEARLEWADGRIVIRTFTGELGSSPFTLTGEGWLSADGPQLDLALSGEDLLFYRADGVTVRADSKLTVRGVPSALAVKGSLALRNSGVVSSVNLLHFAQGGNAGPGRGLRLFSFREPPLSGLVFDVRIITAEPFLVRNNVVRGTLRPDLRLTGTGVAPILDGTLAVEGARVILPAGGVNLDSGRVLFSAADPLVPQLDLTASARRRGYDISVRISGPYDQPVVSLSSVPPLASDKILLLLLTGQAPGRDEAGPAGSDTTTHVVSVYLGQDLLARWLGDSPLGEDGLLDRLDVDVVKDLSRNNAELLQVSYRLSKVPKHGGTVTFLRAEKDLYGRINFGVQFLFRIEG